MSEIEDKFNKHVLGWKQHKRHSSLSSEICSGEDYEAILDLGSDCVPFILKSMKTEADLWFLALRELTGCDPIPLDHYGDINLMTQDWLEWEKVNK